MNVPKYSYKGHSFLCRLCDTRMLFDHVDDSHFNEVTVYFSCPHCNTSLVCLFLERPFTFWSLSF